MEQWKFLTVSKGPLIEVGNENTMVADDVDDLSTEIL